MLLAKRSSHAKLVEMVGIVEMVGMVGMVEMVEMVGIVEMVEIVGSFANLASLVRFQIPSLPLRNGYLQ